MRKKIVIIGAGGLGRIVYDVLSNDLILQGRFILTGFLDTRSDLILPPGMTVPVLGSPLNYQPCEDELFIPAVGNPILREKLIASLTDKGAQFFSYTHQASVAARTSIGEGSFFTPGSVISTDCRIGEFTYLDTYSILGHDVEIGRCCMIGAMSFLSGGVHVGNHVTIHPRATLAKGVKIGNGATIGIGSVVVKDVPDGVTVFGNPARIIYS